MLGVKSPITPFSSGESDMRNLLKYLWRDERGQDLVEYALLVILIVLAAVASIKMLGDTITRVFNNANAAVSGYTT